MSSLRSRAWFGGDTEVGVLHRAAVRALGIQIEADDDRPIIGIANSASDLNPCNAGLRDLAGAVKRGVWAAGGIPLEFPTISLGEDLMKPSAMLYRNLMAMDVEECLRSYPLDGVVLLANCDKTVPAQLMGAVSADLPAIQLTGGSRRAGTFRGRRLGSGTDLWRYWEERRAGRLSDADWDELEACLSCGIGACNTMGTASTMAQLSEALGFMLPGAGAIPSGDARLVAAADASGRRAVELVREDLRPSRILTPASVDNAITVLAAIAGSTNAVIHLCAIAGRRAIRPPLERFDELSRRVPVVADMAPSGAHLMDAFFEAGGLPTVLREIEPYLDTTTVGVTGRTLAETIRAARAADGLAIRSRSDPVAASGGIAVLRGSLAPDGAIMKTAAATAALLRHRGPAVVFRGHEDLYARIDDPDLAVTAESVLVLAGCGPRGVPGMPEWGQIPIPRRLLDAGVSDMVRISDARMSGTAYGTVVLHVAPEAAVGGPLALVRDGDPIRLDVEARVVELEVDVAELARRRADLAPWPTVHRRGWPRLYQEHVTQAPDGCDFDFLEARSADDLPFVPPTIGRS
ncbi:MAG: dihydroxy-acid dehydratase [Chloroflexota bacterium]